MAHERTASPDDRFEPSDLAADCGRCFALCCVAPAFAASSDFALDKAAGVACRNLQRDFRCGIHADLSERGFAGCTVFDCLGAGQKVAQHTFGGEDWRGSPALAAPMFAAFGVMRALHELLVYLREAASLPAAAALTARLAAVSDAVEALTRLRAELLIEVDLEAQRERVSELLLRASELQRGSYLRRARQHRGADLIGVNLRGADLRGALLRGACLIAADLRQADLRSADLLGADLRGARLDGADLRDAIFLLPSQLIAAHGDCSTQLPPRHARPAHWSVVPLRIRPPTTRRTSASSVRRNRG